MQRALALTQSVCLPEHGGNVFGEAVACFALVFRGQSGAGQRVLVELRVRGIGRGADAPGGAGLQSRRVPVHAIRATRFAHQRVASGFKPQFVLFGARARKGGLENVQNPTCKLRSVARRYLFLLISCHHPRGHMDFALLTSELYCQQEGWFVGQFP